MKDGKNVETDEDNIINNVEPLWTKAPSTLKDEDYKKFYHTLYPMQDDPLFWIHLNVDFPFNLTGILYSHDQEQHRHAAQQDSALLQPGVRNRPGRRHCTRIPHIASWCNRFTGHSAERKPQLPAERQQREEDFYLHHQEGSRSSELYLQGEPQGV